MTQLPLFDRTRPSSLEARQGTVRRCGEDVPATLPRPRAQLGPATTPEHPMILNIVVAVVAAAGIALAVGLTWRRSARARASLESAYSPLPDPYGWASAARAAGVAATPDEIAFALGIAVCCLWAHGPWGEQRTVDGLRIRGVRILVRAEAEWTDAYGRRVAGLTYPTERIVVVGSDLDALCHELAELLYWRLEGGLDWQSQEWAGRAGIEAACAAYAERRRAA